jgi:hypothetical protein
MIYGNSEFSYQALVTRGAPIIGRGNQWRDVVFYYRVIPYFGGNEPFDIRPPLHDDWDWPLPKNFLLIVNASG